MKYALLLVFMLSFSCKSSKTAVAADDRLVLLTQDAYFPVVAPESHIIKDTKSLKQFYAKVNRSRKPGLPVPAVDFKKFVVVVACLGPVQGQALPLMGVKKEDDTRITLATYLPKDSQAQKLAMEPFCVYKMAKDGKDIVVDLE